jgi:hypothetical protein
VAVPRSSAFGWAASWQVPSGAASLSLDALPLNGVLAFATLAIWVLATALVVGRGQLTRLVRVRRLRRTRGEPETADAGVVVATAPEASEVVA